MSISRAKKIKKQTVTDFINAADEPKLIKNETQNIWIKKTYYFKPEKIKQLEILKIEQNDNNEQKKFIQELLDEALELLFEKYRNDIKWTKKKGASRDAHTTRIKNKKVSLVVTKQTKPRNQKLTKGMLWITIKKVKKKIKQFLK